MIRSLSPAAALFLLLTSVSVVSATPMPTAPFVPPGPALPAIGVTGDYEALEGIGDRFVIRFIRRAEDLSRPVTVLFRLDQGFLGEVTFAAGDTTSEAALGRGSITFGPQVREIVVRAYPKDDGLIEGLESFMLELKPGNDYKIITADQNILEPLSPGAPAPPGSAGTMDSVLVRESMRLRIYDDIVLFGNESRDGKVKMLDGRPEPLAHYNDIAQGASIGDCQLLSGIGVAWFIGRSVLFTRMIDTTSFGFIVKLRSGHAIVESRRLFDDGSLQARLDEAEADYKSTLPEVWVRVVERALIDRHPGTRCPSVEVAVEELTGVKPEKVPLDGLTPEFIKLHRGRIYIGTRPGDPGDTDGHFDVKLREIPLNWSPHTAYVTHKHAMLIVDIHSDSFGAWWVNVFNPHGIAKSGWVKLDELKSVLAPSTLMWRDSTLD